MKGRLGGSILCSHAEICSVQQSHARGYGTTLSVLRSEEMDSAEDAS